MECFKTGHFLAYMDYYVLDGYGYLVKIFYSDFFFIPFALLGFLIDDLSEAYNLMLITGTFLCGIFSFFAFRNMTGSGYGAILFAVLNTTAVYRFFAMYQRAAFGEAMAITFLPLVLWGIYEIIKGNYKKWYILSIGLSLIIYVHPLTTSIVVIAIALTVLLNLRRMIQERQRIKYLFLSAGVCFILSAYYVLPFIQMTLADVYFYKTNPINGSLFVDNANKVLSGLFRLFEDPKANFSVKIGVLLFMPILILRPLLSRKNNPLLKFSDIFLACGLGLTILCTHLIPWDKFPLTIFSFLQFYFRLLPIVSLFFAFCIATYVCILAKTRNSKIGMFLSILLMNIIGMNGESTYYKNFTCHNYKPLIDVQEDHMALLGAEFLPSSFPKETDEFTAERGRYQILYKNTDTRIQDVSKAAGQMTFDVSIENPDVLELPLTYYIGYRIMLDGNEIPYQKSDHALISIEVKKSGKIETEYIGTKLQPISFIITMMGFIGLFAFIIVRKK